MCNISPQINHILLNLYAKWLNIRRMRMDLQSNWFDWPWSVCTYKLSLARYELLYKRHATRLLHLPLTQTHNSRSRRIYGHRVENTFPKWQSTEEYPSWFGCAEWRMWCNKLAAPKTNQFDVWSFIEIVDQISQETVISSCQSVNYRHSEWHSGLCARPRSLNTQPISNRTRINTISTRLDMNKVYTHSNWIGRVLFDSSAILGYCTISQSLSLFLAGFTRF